MFCLTQLNTHLPPPSPHTHTFVKWQHYVVESIGPEIRLGLKFSCLPFQIVWPWTSHVISLILSFPVRVWIIASTSTSWVCWVCQMWRNCLIILVFCCHQSSKPFLESVEWTPLTDFLLWLDHLISVFLKSGQIWIRLWVFVCLILMLFTSYSENMVASGLVAAWLIFGKMMALR